MVMQFTHALRHFVSATFIGVSMMSVSAQSPYDPDIEALIKKMTIEEKVGQMTQLNLDVISKGEIYNLVEPHQLFAEKLKKALVDYHVGSILNCGGHAYTREHWREIIGEIQRVATKETRLGIPIIYGIDAIHGANYTLGSTLFPQQIGQAATFNEMLVARAAEITAYEVRASGITWNFSPVLDLMRNPQWSRCFETFGEDVLLAKNMTHAAITGYQGATLTNDPVKVAACMKHFLGYSMPRTGMDRTPAYISDILLREYFLPTFQEAVQSGAATVMINSGEINGIPVHANKKIVTDLLRTELGFEGVAVTDWEDIMKLNNFHKVAPTMKDAVRMAIDAGIDMSMVPNNYEFCDLLVELVKEGTITEERLDVSVRRILILKKKLGLFENPMPAADNNYAAFGNASGKLVSQLTAEESITLLKNANQLLPLDAKTKILVTGPGADSYTMLNGAWTRTWQGTDTKWDDPSVASIYDALKNMGGENVQYVQGCTTSALSDYQAALTAAQQVDVIIACMGELPSTEIPGNIQDMHLDKAQLDYISMLSATGKPLILLLTESRPRIIRDIEPNCNAILQLYYPGDMGGVAAANIIYGKVNPSGKLPYTYPKYANALLWYDHKHTETMDVDFGNDAFDPQWTFGYGLSYTTFEYSNLYISNDTMTSAGLTVSVTVKNTGSRVGKEVVQLYLSDQFASITPSVKRLKAYQKIELQPQESRVITFQLTPEQLQFVGADLQWIAEPGWFDVSINGSKTSFYYKSN